MRAKDIKSPETPGITAFQDFGGGGGIRTLVSVTRQTLFESAPLRPLRYASVYFLVNCSDRYVPVGTPHSLPQN